MADAGIASLTRANPASIHHLRNIQSNSRLLPIDASHALVRHQAVLLPAQPIEYESKPELLASIREYIHRYVDLDETFEAIAAHYVLLSWVYDAFNELPYLRLRGDYGTGKTRALIVLGSILYRPFFASGASTVSPIFHTLDTFRGSLVFDEADFRFSDEKAELVKILNNGSANAAIDLRAAGAVLFGRREVEGFFYSTFTSGPVSRNDSGVIVPNVEASAALAFFLGENASIAVGYSLDHYWNVFDMNPFPGSSNKTNRKMHGPFLRVTVGGSS